MSTISSPMPVRVGLAQDALQVIANRGHGEIGVLCIGFQQLSCHEPLAQAKPLRGVRPNWFFTAVSGDDACSLAGS